MWTLNGQPAFRDYSSGWLVIDDVQYPPDWPRADLEALGLEWVEPNSPEKPKPTLAQCLKFLADRRWWKAQTFAYDGVDKAPAEPARSRVLAILEDRRRDQVDPEATQAFKLVNGEFRSWSEANLIAYQSAIGYHVQACFDREAELTAEIIVAEDPSSVDTSTGWPS